MKNLTFLGYGYQFIDNKPEAFIVEGIDYGTLYIDGEFLVFTVQKELNLSKDNASVFIPVGIYRFSLEKETYLPEEVRIVYADKTFQNLVAKFNDNELRFFSSNLNSSLDGSLVNILENAYRGTNDFPTLKHLHPLSSLKYWKVEAISFNAQKYCLEVFINKYNDQPFQLIIENIIATKGGSYFIKKQASLIRKIYFLKDAFEILYKPKNSILYLHPELFGINNNLNSKNLALFYQLALCNGLLVERIENDSTTNILWEEDQYNRVVNANKNLTSCIVLLKYLDANSHPIVCIPSRDVTLKITKRIGYPDPTFAVQGLTIEGLSIDSIKDLEIKSIHYSSIDWEKREKILFHQFNEDSVGELYGTEDTLSLPYWSKENGDVIVSDLPPKEIYGLAKGMRIVKTNEKSTPFLANLTTQPIQDSENRVIYHEISLGLNPDDWIIETLYEEKETRKADSTTINISKRRFSSNEVIEIPAFDYVFGASNITAEDDIPLIPRRIGEWAERLDHALTENLSVQSENQKHISGFLRQHNEDEEEKFFGILGYPGQQLESPVLTAPITPKLDTSRVTFRHAPKKKSQESLINNQLDFSKLDLFERLWNDIDFLEEWYYLLNLSQDKIDDVKEIIRALKEKIGAIREEFGREIVEISSNKIPQEAENTLRSVQRLAEANLKEIKGIGRKFIQIKNLILSVPNEIWTVKIKDKNYHYYVLSLLWDLTTKIEILIDTTHDEHQKWVQLWSEIQSKLKQQISIRDLKILKAFFDYYYHPFDSSVLANLAQHYSILKQQVETQLVSREELEILEKKLKELDGALGNREKNLKDILNEVEKQVVPEVVSDVLQGVDPNFKKLQKVWDEAEGLKKKYGHYLDIETYKRVLKDAAEEEGDELKKRLRNLESRLTKKLSQAINDKLNDLNSWTEEVIRPYEEELWQYIQFANDFYNRYEPYAQAVSAVQKCIDIDNPNGRVDCIKTTYKNLDPAVKTQLEELIEKPLERHYNILWDKAKQRFEDFLDNHQKEIYYVVELAVEVNEIFERIQKLKSFEDCITGNQGNAKETVSCFFKTVFKQLSEEEKEALKLFTQDLFFEYFEVVKESVEQEFEAFVKAHPEIFYIILLVVFKYNECRALVEEVKEGIFEIEQLIKELKKLGEGGEIVAKTIASFIAAKLGISIRLADIRIEKPQYLVFGKHITQNLDPETLQYYKNWLDTITRSRLPLCTFESEKLWKLDFRADSIIIIKLGNDITLGEILEEIEENNRKQGVGPFGTTLDKKSSLKELKSLLHPDISFKQWRGILIVDPIADISQDRLLRDLCGRSQFEMKYAAIGGDTPDTKHDKDATVIKRDLDIYARIKQSKEPLESEPENNEIKFTLTKFDVTIKNTQIESGEIEFKFEVAQLFGESFEEKENVLTVKGSLPKDENGKDGRDFEFSATLKEPLTIELDIGFLKSLKIKSLKAARRDNKSTLEIDAKLLTKNFKEVISLDAIDFKNFRVIIPSLSESVKMGVARLLNFDLPAVEAVVNKPRALNFFGIELIPKGIGFIRGDNNAFNALTHNGFWVGKELKELKENTYFNYLRVSVDFGKLPVTESSGGIIFDAIIGFTYDSSPAVDPYPFWLIYGVSGSDIVLDLFRFITLEAKRLIVGKFRVGKDEIDATGLFLNQASLKILDWPVLGENGYLDFLYLQNEIKPEKENIEVPQKAFLAHYNNPKETKNSFFKIYWILCAHNLTIDAKILNALLSPNNVNQVGNLLEENQIFKEELGDEYNVGSTYDLANIEFTEQESWLFGGSFSLAGILDACTIILQDQHFYGIMLASSQGWFKTVFGVDRFSLAYMPGARKELDRFRVEFPLAGLNFLSNLKSGLIALELAINKDFLFDFGFPWRTGNTYMWHRTFSFVSGIYETRFGFYFEKRTEVTPQGELLSFGAGIALSYGYSVSARSPFAWAEAGIAVTVILAGKITFKKIKGTSTTELTKLSEGLHSIEVIGVIGIYAYARGGINYWVITAEIRAEIVAAIAGRLLYLPQGNSSLTYSATLYVTYYASCRIKLGFIKKTFTISGRLSYEVRGRYALN